MSPPPHALHQGQPLGGVVPHAVGADGPPEVGIEIERRPADEDLHPMVAQQVRQARDLQRRREHQGRDQQGIQVVGPCRVREGFRADARPVVGDRIAGDAQEGGDDALAKGVLVGQGSDADPRRVGSHQVGVREHRGDPLLADPAAEVQLRQRHRPLRPALTQPVEHRTDEALGHLQWRGHGEGQGQHLIDLLPVGNAQGGAEPLGKFGCEWGGGIVGAHGGPLVRGCPCGNRPGRSLPRWVTIIHPQ